MLNKLSVRVIIAVLLTIPIPYLFGNLNITTSASLDHRFFWKVNGPIQKGDYVLFEIAHPLIGAEPRMITKQLACWEGDTLEVKGRDYYCNGEFLGTAKETSRSGKALPQFIFNGTIPEGMAFASAPHKDSFDSRYWGFLDLSIGQIQKLKGYWALSRKIYQHEEIVP